MSVNNRRPATNGSSTVTNPNSKVANNGVNTSTGQGISKLKRDGSGWEEWGGYMAAKRQKLQNQFTADKPMEAEKEGESSSIFQGITIHVNGYTKPSSDELKRLMMLHGGRYEHFMSKTRVTHVIATSMANSKVKDFKHMKIVKPEWITESVKAKRLLSYIPYQLYTAQTGLQHGLASFTSTTATCHSTRRSVEPSGFSNQTYHSTSQSLLPSCDNNQTGIKHQLQTSVSSMIWDQPSVTLKNIDSGDIQDDFDPEYTVDINSHDKYMYLDSKKDSGNSRLIYGDNLEAKINQRNEDKMSDVADFQDDFNPEYTVDINSHDKYLDTKKDSGNSRLIYGDNLEIKINQRKEDKMSEEMYTVGSHLDDHHNKSQLKSPPNKATSNKHSPAKAGDPDFLSEFYSNSRLHHLSTWKSEWRTYVNKLQKQGATFPGRNKLLNLVQQKANELSERVASPPSVTTSGKPSRVIMHIDMDCFFVAVGLRNRPDLKGKPIVVTHSRGKGIATDNPGSDLNFERRQWKLRRQQGGKKGKRKSLPLSDQPSLDNRNDDNIDDDAINHENSTVDQHGQDYPGQTFHSMADIASCSYEARKAGVKNGMSMGKAKQLCPDLITIPYDFDGYQEVSKMLYDTVASYTHDIEAVSCDEMLVDCTDLLSVTGAEPLDFAKLLREEIFSKTNCTASAGMGSNILLAKMATKKAKPNGQYYLPPDEVLGFISDQSIDNIPGVGWSMSRKLHDMKVSTCGDLQKVPLSVLQSEFGNKTGQSLYNYSRGQDNRPIKTEQERKSVSAEINYGIRLKNDIEAEQFLKELSEEVHSRLANIEMKGKTITLKIMARRPDAPKETAKFMGHGICNSMSKSVTLPVATDDTKIISKECITILRNLKVKAIDLRGIGIQVQKLEPVHVSNTGVKGAQSILNFAVTKTHAKDNIVSHQNGTESSIKVPKTNADKIPDNNTTYSSAAKLHCSNTERQTTISGRKLDDLPSLLPIQTNSPNTASETFDPLTSELSILTNGDEGQETSLGIMGELARRKTAKKILPPLPALPDLSLTPESDDSLTSSGRPRRSKRSTHPVTVSEDYFPSPSQIDPDVLKELPPDVRRQIESEMKSRQKKKKDRPLVVEENIQRASCSHWSSSQPFQPNSTNQMTAQHSSNHVDDAIVPLPSPSQLDESCLNALPADLQKELRDAYALQTEQEQSKLSSHAKSSWLHDTKSPPKKQPAKSPGKGKKNSPSKKSSPVFKVPQSRPARGRKKLSPKKLDFHKQPKINVAAVGKKDIIPVLVESDNEKSRPSDIVRSRPKSVSMPCEETPGPSTTDQHHHTENIRKCVNLCGAVTITEVRNLLREWLQSSAVPEADDEEMMIEYLRDLVFDHNLEQVDLVVKFLIRNIRKLNSTEWMSSLKNIVDALQIVIQSMYGCKMSLPDDYELPNG